MERPGDEELIPTRATLIQRLKNLEDQASWQDFFDTYWKLIYGVARKSGLTETESQDVVQETMVSVARQMPTFKYDPRIGSFKAWLLNLTRWRMGDQFRRRGPLFASQEMETTSPESSSVLHETPDPASHELDRIWDAEWEKNLVNAAIDRVKRRLDPQRYQVFDFCVNKEWPPQKVAEAFKISVDQVYLAKHRVTDLVKKEVKRLEREML